MTRTRFPAYAVTGSERAAGSGPWCGIGANCRALRDYFLSRDRDMN